MGSPGIGKSRIVREAAAIANDRGVEVFTTYCESHASQIPFHVVARMLREVFSEIEVPQRGRGYGPFSDTPTPTIWSCSTICWASATATPGCPMSPPTLASAD
jgi:predicted ATPase